MVLRTAASPLPIAWVTADSAYGQDNRFRRLLEQSGVGYVPAVPKSQFSVCCSRGAALFAQAPEEAWAKISCGDGAKWPRVYHCAVVRLPAVAEFDHQGGVSHRMRWALARRSISKPDESAYYYPAYTPLQVTVQELVRVAGARWAIEECFQAAKNECGLEAVRSPPLRGLVSAHHAVHARACLPSRHGTPALRKGGGTGGTARDIELTVAEVQPGRSDSKVLLEYQSSVPWRRNTRWRHRNLFRR